MVLSTICRNQNLQCDSTDCEEKGKVFPLYCQKAKEGLCTSVSYLADGIEAERTEEEEELLSVFNSLGSAALKKVAIDQMKLLVGLKLSGYSCGVE